MFTYSEEDALNFIIEIILLKSKKWSVFYLEDCELLKVVELFTDFNSENSKLYSVLSDGCKLEILTDKADLKRKIVQKVKSIGFRCAEYHVDHSSIRFEKI